MTQIIPYIFYRDVPAALDWLTRAFGFVEVMRTGTPRGGMHGEMALDGQKIMMGQGLREKRMLSAADTEAATQGVFIYLDDVDAHYARARAAGATIDWSSSVVGRQLPVPGQSAVLQPANVAPLAGVAVSTTEARLA